MEQPWGGLMKSRWKSFTALAAVSLLAFGIAGCSDTPTELGSGNESTTVELIDAGEYLIYDEDTGNPNDWYSATLNKDGLVETEDGSYYTWWVPSPETEPDLYSDEYWNSSVTAEQLQQAGYTEADAIEARLLAYQMVQVAYDSETIDRALSSDERAEWAATVATTLPISAEVQSLMSQDDTQVVMQGFKDGMGQLPVLLKDGAPRSVSADIFARPTGFSILSNDNGAFLSASFDTDVSYRVSDEAMLAYLEARGSSHIPRDVLSDGVGTNLLHARGTYDVGVQKQPDGSLQIVGLRDTYEISTDY